MELLFTFAGLLGVALILVAYVLLAAGKVSARGARYQWLNVLGTAGILLSLLGEWNMPAFVTNVAWISVGIVSLFRIYLTKETV